MKVLVTGATGFTGQHLVRRLLAEGQNVRVVARSADRARTAFDARVEIEAGDVADREVIRRAVPGCRVIYHLAAAYREAGLPDSRYRDVHVDSTRLLLEAAKDEGIERFIHCSTVGVLGHISHPPADENTPYSPGDVYQATKAEGERLALDLSARYGVPLTVARPTAIYGPGDLRLLKLFRMIARRRFVMVGNGRIYYHMVHVDDLVDGLRLLAQRSEANGEVFILGGEGYRSLNELVALIAHVVGAPPPRWNVPAWPIQIAGSLCEKICAPLGVPPPIYRRRVDFFTKSRAFSIEKARRLLGYQPKIDLERGFVETTKWYRDQGYLPPPADNAHG
ncbi:MAG TPA: NAD-dependent epimerase/dehydratase family protein [Vicinamibacterales bacterium]|nr:NAD-dependent epimerase/dehydratase family protein [Vicinamibacterales bacterium]